MQQAMFDSPSLTNGAEAAYELKLRVPTDLAETVEAWARQRLHPDPHGIDGRYQTTSLYCDTANLDVYRRSDGFRRRKYRLRRYGDAERVYLERKKRQGDRVWKKRDAVAIDDLMYLAGVEPAADWVGGWFLERLRLRDLRPICKMVYQRTAFLGDVHGERVRLTLDRDLVGVPEREWDLSPVRGGKPLLPGGVVLEMKFHTTLPAVFRELLELLPQGLGRASKYRLCVGAWGLASEGR